MNMKAYILRLGYEHFDSNVLVHGSTQVTKSNPNVMHQWVNAPIWSVVIDYPGREKKIMFDCGGHIPKEARDDRYPWTMEPDETMERQLALIGLKPEDIDTVIVSHMHMDHFGSAPLFTHCDMYVPKEDWVNGLITVHGTSDRSKWGSYVPECMFAPIKNVHPIAIDEDMELLPGIEIITVPGHSWNDLALVLHLEHSGTLIFPADAVYNREIYGPPVKMPGLCTDNVRFRASVEKIRRLQKKYHAEIMYSHDEEMFQQFKKAPEYYD